MHSSAVGHLLNDDGTVCFFSCKEGILPILSQTVPPCAYSTG